LSLFKTSNRSASCPAFENGMYNVSYGYAAAAQTYQKTFLPQITERMNMMSKDYKLTGMWLLSDR